MTDQVDNLQQAVLNQKQIIQNQITEAAGDYRIKVKDHVGAIQFKKYAKSVEWIGHEFKIQFEDSMNVSVNLSDFIEYQLYYTDYALSLESQFSDQINDLRDLQGDIKDEFLEKLLASVD
ncbi:hypothetical protein ACQE3D_25335 (plasmid) [Methylomonas sp. MS20]|uniref:hypothetical protein n=1 Tax=Methylomonas sp. MS20 TaxID=3418769 RepID=UPI003CFE2F96